MRMSLPSEGSGPAHSYFEVPFDWPIEVECIQEVPPSRESAFIAHVTTTCDLHHHVIITHASSTLSSPETVTTAAMCSTGLHLFVHVKHLGCSDEAVYRVTSLLGIPVGHQHDSVR